MRRDRNKVFSRFRHKNFCSGSFFRPHPVYRPQQWTIPYVPSPCSKQLGYSLNINLLLLLLLLSPTSLSLYLYQDQQINISVSIASTLIFFAIFCFSEKSPYMTDKQTDRQTTKYILNDLFKEQKHILTAT